PIWSRPPPRGRRVRWLVTRGLAFTPYSRSEKYSLLRDLPLATFAGGVEHAASATAEIDRMRMFDPRPVSQEGAMLMRPLSPYACPRRQATLHTLPASLRCRAGTIPNCAGIRCYCLNRMRQD